MSKTITRRTAVTGLAAAPAALAATQAPAFAAVDPDADLLALCRDWHGANAAFRAYQNPRWASGEDPDAEANRLSEGAWALLRRIADTPARSNAGLIAKAKVARAEVEGDRWGDGDILEQLAISVIDDAASGRAI
ncbi:hypothetical protein [Microbaculum marinisediminis]|uniref:Uncharacterized protein n=1 Tax=Microbaculum marinisediminis TaxID=2931392 RepID=A0AAW5QS10_9HYPH|nr:hypothetical protein [Microbaculum sp. A6E488]MCT8970881.1 hypothetical protein [Microbaculum sp. A6E488]